MFDGYHPAAICSLDSSNRKKNKSFYFIKNSRLCCRLGGQSDCVHEKSSLPIGRSQVERSWSDGRRSGAGLLRKTDLAGRLSSSAETGKIVFFMVGRTCGGGATRAIGERGFGQFDSGPSGCLGDFYF